jgi:hypothetical protein
VVYLLDAMVHGQRERERRKQKLRGEQGVKISETNRCLILQLMFVPVAFLSQSSAVCRMPISKIGLTTFLSIGRSISVVDRTICMLGWSVECLCEH